jgi:hypothetical protein
MLFFFFSFAQANNMKKIKLDDIFSIKTGLLELPGEEYYSLDSSGNEVNVRILRMGSFDSSLRKIKPIHELEKAEQRLVEFRKQREKRYNLGKNKKTEFHKKEKKLIDFDKLIDKDDYVINTRNLGEDVIINGYSLLKSLTAQELHELGPLAISHHFIVLRPRKSMLNLHVPFLHMMLDIVVDKVLPSMVSSLGVIKSRQLKDLEIEIPLDFNEQKALHEQYQILENECEKAGRALEDFKKSFVKER